MNNKRLDIRIDFNHKKIILTKKFSKQASFPDTREYAELQTVRADYPDFKVTIRKPIKKNSNKESYKGLNYDYMRDYISHYEPSKTRGTVLAELEELIIRSRCHSNGFRYPTIKSWFLERYPEVKDFGKSRESKDSLDTKEDLKGKVA